MYDRMYHGTPSACLHGPHNITSDRDGLAVCTRLLSVSTRSELSLRSAKRPPQAQPRPPPLPACMRPRSSGSDHLWKPRHMRPAHSVELAGQARRSLHRRGLHLHLSLGLRLHLTPPRPSNSPQPRPSPPPQPHAQPRPSPRARPSLGPGGAHTMASRSPSRRAASRVAVRACVRARVGATAVACVRARVGVTAVAHAAPLIEFPPRRKEGVLEAISEAISACT